MKKLFTRVILAAICLIPTLMALLLYMNAQKSPIESSDLASLEWESPSGSRQQFLMKNPDDEQFISFLLKLNENAQEVDKLPAELQNGTPYKATFLANGVHSVYRYYFSTVSPSNSYYVDSQNRIYRINATDTIAFLDSSYSIDLYPASVLPTLTVAGECLDAATVSWTYYTYSGTGHTLTQENSEVPLLTASYVGISLSPSLIPDSGLLEITDDNDQILYKGSLADYNFATALKQLIRKDTLLHFSIEAKWNSHEGSRYQGSANFRFDVQTIFDPAAHFWLGETSVELGEMVVLSGEFVESLDDLSFSSSPSIGFTPQFIQDGDLVRALVPIPRELASGSGQYTFTVTCQGKEYPLTLNVTEATHSEAVKTYNYSKKVNTNLRTESNLAEFRDLIASLPVTSTLYTSGSFVLSSGEGLRAQYGQIIHNTAREEDQFRSNGIAIVAYEGTGITAVNNGKVVAVATTAYGGNTVVVDHGWGLFSVYYCLGSVEVEVGAYVTADSIIGYGGREGQGVGYTDGITCYCELWVGSQPISYYPLKNEGIIVGAPE